MAAGETTSSGLLALVISSLAARAPEALPAGLRMPDCSLAHASAETKRGLLARAYEIGGPSFILGMGRRSREIGFDPVLLLMRSSSCAAVLGERWQRFERYTHSSHRTSFEFEGERSVRLTRRSEGASRPTAAENMLIYGLAAVLMEDIGALGLRMTLGSPGHALTIWEGGAPAELEREAFELADPAAGAVLLDWSAFEAVEVPDSGLPAPLIVYGANEALPTTRAVVDRVLADLGHRWSLEALGRELALSSRSLQRRLAAEGTKLSDIVKVLRVRSACALLARGELSLTEIGFHCGYSDSAHFSREFRRALGMPPTIYRETGRGSGTLRLEELSTGIALVAD